MAEELEEKTTPFGVNLMRSPVLYRAAQGADSSTYTCAAVHQLVAVACLHHHAWKSCVDPTQL